MSDIVIAGIGQIPVGEHYSIGLREMGVRALLKALRDSGDLKPDALYIGNLLSSMISHQSNLGALFTDYTNLEGVEAYTTEAAGASGAAAGAKSGLKSHTNWTTCCRVGKSRSFRSSWRSMP